MKYLVVAAKIVGVTLMHARKQQGTKGL